MLGLSPISSTPISALSLDRLKKLLRQALTITQDVDYVLITGNVQYVEVRTPDSRRPRRFEIARLEEAPDSITVTVREPDTGRTLALLESENRSRLLEFFVPREYRDYVVDIRIIIPQSRMLTAGGRGSAGYVLTVRPGVKTSSLLAVIPESRRGRIL